MMGYEKVVWTDLRKEMSMVEWMDKTMARDMAALMDKMMGEISTADAKVDKKDDETVESLANMKVAMRGYKMVVKMVY